MTVQFRNISALNTPGFSENVQKTNENKSQPDHFTNSYSNVSIPNATPPEASMLNRLWRPAVGESTNQTSIDAHLATDSPEVREMFHGLEECAPKRDLMNALLNMGIALLSSQSGDKEVS